MDESINRRSIMINSSPREHQLQPQAGTFEGDIICSILRTLFHLCCIAFAPRARTTTARLGSAFGLGLNMNSVLFPVQFLIVQVSRLTGRIARTHVLRYTAAALIGHRCILIPGLTFLLGHNRSISAAVAAVAAAAGVIYLARAIPQRVTVTFLACLRTCTSIVV